MIEETWANGDDSLRGSARLDGIDPNWDSFLEIIKEMRNKYWGQRSQWTAIVCADTMKGFEKTNQFVNADFGTRNQTDRRNWEYSKLGVNVRVCPLLEEYLTEKATVAAGSLEYATGKFPAVFVESSSLGCAYGFGGQGPGMGVFNEGIEYSNVAGGWVSNLLLGFGVKVLQKNGVITAQFNETT